MTHCATRIISSYTSSASVVVRLPALPGTLVYVTLSAGNVIGGCSVTWMPYSVQRVPFHSNQSFKFLPLK